MKKKTLNPSKTMATAAASPSSSGKAVVAETVMGPTLPTDLIINILLRLPVKALGKSKCVSKQWLDIISGPFFICLHRAHSLENPNLLLAKKIVSLDDSCKIHSRTSARIDFCSMGSDGSHNFDFTFNIDDEGVELLPSKWEVVCFAAVNGFYLCNPSTQEMVKLPEGSCCTSGDVNAGFWYVKERNEYVLVHLFDKSLDLHVDTEIGCELMWLREGCCVKDCTWRVVDANCPFVVRDWGVLVDNVFYWMIWDYYESPGDEAIVAFDMAMEEFRTVAPPEGLLDPNGMWVLVELCGRLCLVDNATRPFTMDIWVLKDYENHMWVKEYSIDLNRFSFNQLKFIVPLDCRGGEILIDNKQGSLDYYDVENKCFKRTGNLRAGNWTWLRLYTESFFPLGS